MSKFKPTSNYHTHTVFSDGVGSVEANILAAIDSKMTSLGFSDHSYVAQAGFGISHENAAPYVREVRRCATLYADKIDVFCGLELDADTPFDRELYDYIIASVHFLNAGGAQHAVDLSADVQRACIAQYFGSDELRYAAAYFDAVAEHVEKTQPDIVGHFDLLTKFGVIDEASDGYRRCALDAVRRVVKSCGRFEVNTGAMARGLKDTPYPADFILSELLSLGGTVVLSSDAHKPENIAYAFEKTAEHLRALGFESIDRLTPQGFVSEAL